MAGHGYRWEGRTRAAARAEDGTRSLSAVGAGASSVSRESMPTHPEQEGRSGRPRTLSEPMWGQRRTRREGCSLRHRRPILNCLQPQARPPRQHPGRRMLSRPWSPRTKPPCRDRWQSSQPKRSSLDLLPNRRRVPGLLSRPSSRSTWRSSPSERAQTRRGTAGAGHPAGLESSRVSDRVSVGEVGGSQLGGTSACRWAETEGSVGGTDGWTSFEFG